MTKDEERKTQILEAALNCFLQFGYVKTSMDDVAKKAKLSRPLIYLKFKNKEDLFFAIYLDLMEKGLTKAEPFLEQKISKKEKLRHFCEATLLEPWDRLANNPMAAEFYELCITHFPKEAEKFDRKRHKMVQPLFPSKEIAEVFVLSLEGLHTYVPSTNILRKRVYILIDQFSN